MIDKSRLLKSQGSLYLEFIPKDGLFHKMLLLSLMGFLTGWCNLKAFYFKFVGWLVGWLVYSGAPTFVIWHHSLSWLVGWLNFVAKQGFE